MQTILLNQDKFRLPSAVYSILGNQSEEIKMRVTDHALTSGSVGTVYSKGPGGIKSSVPSTLALDDNSFTADLAAIATQLGAYKCILEVVDNGAVSAYKFLLFVRSTPRLYI